MAARTVLTTNTLEEFRTTFNSLSTTDIGDPATLTTTATDVVGRLMKCQRQRILVFLL